MKRLFLFLLIFSVNFIKSADSSVPEKAKKAFLQASKSDQVLIVNYLVASCKLIKNTNSSIVTLGKVQEAADGYFFLISRDVQDYLAHLDMQNYLRVAKQVYDSIDEQYRKELGEKLLNPYE